MPKKTATRRRSRNNKGKKNKSKSSILNLFTSLMPKSKKKNCYQLRNPYHDVLAEQIKNGKQISKTQKKNMCDIVKKQQKKGKNCLKAANSADEFDISILENKCQ